MVRKIFKISMFFSSMFLIASCSNFFSDFTNDDGSLKTGRDEVTHSSSDNTIVYPSEGVVTGELYNTVTDKGFVIIKNTLPGYNLIDFDDSRNDYEIGDDSTTTDSKINLGIADNPLNFRCFPDDKNATVKWSIIRTAVAHLNGTTETIAAENQKEEPLSYSGTERNFITKIPYGSCIVKAVVYADDPMYNTTYTFKLNKPVLADFTEDILIDLTTKTDGSPRSLTSEEFSPNSDYNKYRITRELLEDLPDYIRLEKVVYYPNYDWSARNLDGSRLPLDAPGQVKVELSDPVGKEIILGQGKSTLAITYEDTTDRFKITKQINFNKHEVGDTKLLNQNFDRTGVLHAFSGIYKNGANVDEGEYLRGLKLVNNYSDFEFAGHDTTGQDLSGIRNDGDYFEFYARADREVYFRTDNNSAASQENNFIFECKPFNDHAYIGIFKENGDRLVLEGELTDGETYYGLKKDLVASPFNITLKDVSDSTEDVRIENIRIKTHPYAHYEDASDTVLKSDVACHRVAIRTPGKGNKQLLAYRIYGDESPSSPVIDKNAGWDDASLSWHLNDSSDAETLGSKYRKWIKLSVFAANRANDSLIKASAKWKEDVSLTAKDIDLSVVKDSDGEFYIYGYKYDSLTDTYTTGASLDKEEFNLPPGKIEVSFYVDANDDGVVDDDEDKKTLIITNMADSSTACSTLESSDIAEYIDHATAANNGKTYYIVPDDGNATITVKMNNSWQVPEFYATDTNGTKDAAGHYPNLCGTPEHVEGSRYWIVKMTSLPGTKDVRMLVTANDGTAKNASDVYSAPTYVSLMKESTYKNADFGTAPSLSTTAASPTELEEDVIYKEYTFKSKGAYQTVEVELNDGNTSALDVVTSNNTDYTIRLGNSTPDASDVIMSGTSILTIKITSLSGTIKTYTYYIKRKSLMAQIPLSSDGTALSTDPASPTVLPSASGNNRWVTELTVVTESETDVVTVTATHSEHNPKAVAERTAGNEWKVTVGTANILYSGSQGLPNGVTTVNITVSPQGGTPKTYTYYIYNPNS